jgi:hypothetical protein
MALSGSSTTRPATTVQVVFRATVAVVVLTAAVVVVGVGLAAVLSARGDTATWTRWSDVGQAFGVVNSVVSALAVAAVLTTWVFQRQEMRAQWTELAEQGRVLRDTQAALRRSADVDVRKMHVSLIQMALDRPDLAEVWPAFGAPDPATTAQHMYANLMLQHAWLLYTAGVSNEEELLKLLRHLFTSSKVRAYWRDTADARMSLYTDGTEEFSLAMAADRIWAEYQ